MDLVQQCRGRVPWAKILPFPSGLDAECVPDRGTPGDLVELITTW